MCVIRVQRHWREVTAARSQRARLEKIAAKKREKEKREKEKNVTSSTEASPKPVGRRMSVSRRLSLSMPANPLATLMHHHRRSSRVAPDLTDHRS
jgi:hypothetical protein